MNDDECQHLAEDLDRVYREIVAAVARYRPEADLELIRLAFEVAREKHRDQTRRSGEAYITHPLAVARILADLEMDPPTLAAGLLHDVVEDTELTQEEMILRFGPEVAALVDGVTKLQTVGRDVFADDQGADADPPSPGDPERTHKQRETIRKAANLRRIFLAMARDLRVIIIKLADRLHNMRTLGAMSETQQKRVALETLQIFAPLAHRLGIWQLKWELEDLSLKYLEPEAYERLASQVAQTRGDRQGEVDEAIAILKERLAADGIDAHITGRPKHLYSIYQKMRKQELDFGEIHDLVALRVIVHTRQECYHALGVISGLWTPMPGMFSDHIARSKSNLYQSLHMKVMGPHDKPLEVQIRTWEMHRTAEFGVAAHWAYKEQGEGGKASDQFELKLSWLRQQLFDWQADAGDSSDFLRSVTEDLFADQVFVFTPRGDVIDLPAGATPIDFAYRIHSDVGQHADGARVNGRLVPLSYQFRNGDVATIITRTNASPSRDWLAFVKTAHARAKIRGYFRRLLHDENVQQGREMLQREAKRLGLDPHALLKDEALRSVAPQFKVQSEAELLAAIGYGTVSVGAVVSRLMPEEAPEPRGIVVGRGRADESTLKVTAGSVDNVLFRRARCCLPVPGDAVVGYVTRGRGMALHRVDCPNALHYRQSEPERLIAVEYAGSDSQVYSVNLLIETIDRTGLLADVGTVFGELKTNITAVRTQTHRDRTATLGISVEVKDAAHLNRLFTAIRRLPDILDVSRAVGGREK
ncbi:MAG: bifunctional (p)ppGpp synthetase/guanosine-3',5'-bis(diphosphate) 3'-pyrophosphohydrolase [Chthonomonadales bacterium]|nr:bifunctional (p)ppGpp synthetase/guanosine-3',5'-bis(diphosphate) 3'-pyrophosphohydrolase [Chthonomonadales bacterium]